MSKRIPDNVTCYSKRSQCVSTPLSVTIMVSFFIWLYTGLAVNTHAQTVTDTLPNKNVVIVQDSLIRFLVEQNIANNELKKTMSGFRVQIASSTNRKSILELKTQFEQLYPDAKAYFIYQQPYFKLRIGNFQTRLAANQFLQIVLKDFDAAFIVPDEISVTE